MKKLFYILMFVAINGLTITSCTEDEVSPSAKTESNAGGQGSGDDLTVRK